jgi:hypothetical protein
MGAVRTESIAREAMVTQMLRSGIRMAAMVLQLLVVRAELAPEWEVSSPAARAELAPEWEAPSWAATLALPALEYS